MKFFKPEDLKESEKYHPHTDLANSKLERDVRVVYCDFPRYEESTLSLTKFNEATHTAFLINIKPISPCTHPKEKVSGKYADENGVIFRCECGTRVQPKEFEEVRLEAIEKSIEALGRKEI